MNDKKEPFNAVGDPFFKQVGEEHVEVEEEEGNGGRGLPGSGRGDSALGNGYGGRVPREGLNGDFFVAAAAMDAAVSKLQCRYNAAMVSAAMAAAAAGRPSQVEVDIFRAVERERGRGRE